MNGRERLRLSKFLSLLLRHRPEKAGLSLDPAGWVAVDDLLAGLARTGWSITRQDLGALVKQDGKQRYTFSDDGDSIRANQGHSIPVALGLVSRTPPDTLYHGTVRRSLESILAVGLQRRGRQYVHLSTDLESAQRVGKRHGIPVVLQVAAGEMQAQGHLFYLSKNGIWMVEAVPAVFLRLRSGD